MILWEEEEEEKDLRGPRNKTSKKWGIIEETIGLETNEVGGLANGDGKAIWQGIW